MDQPTQKETRPPINLRIKFRSESVEQFIERYAVDVSRGGIFIRTRDPLAVGTPLKLDFQFQNGGALMSGDGTVVWIRELDPNRASVPPGMGVRFDKLTPESQVVLEQLLVEKAKRERGGIPGSGAQTGGGMAVRRTSSMFSVLEPQAAANEIATNAKAAPGATATMAPVGAPTASPVSTPVALPTAAAISAAIAPPKSVPAVPAVPAAGAVTPAPASAAALYRPLGTARNPFSAVTETGAAIASPASLSTTATSGSAQTTESSRPSPVATDADDDAAPFDDISDEPTQIAGRLPSFLTSDEEETTVGSLPLAPAAREAAPTSAKATSGENPKTPAPEPRRLPGSVGAKAPLPERKTGAQAATPIGATPSRPKQSLDLAAPVSSQTARELIKKGAANKDPARDTAKDVAATAQGAFDEESEKTPQPVVSAAQPADTAPASSAAAPTPTVPVAPIAAELPERQPSVAAAAATQAPTSMTAAATLAAPNRATGTAAKIAPAATHAVAPQAFKAQPTKKRSPAALIGVTVLVLGASSIFLFRFFASNATEPVSPSSSAPAGAVATGEPATVTGQAAVPAPEVTTPPPGPVPTGSGAEPTGTPATAAPAATPEPAAAEPVVPDPSVPPTAKTETAPSVAVVRGPAVESGAAGPKGGKTKPSRAARHAGPTETAAAAPASEAKPSEAKPSEAKPSEPAAAPPAEAPAAEAEAPAHQIRITSKPAGADVMLDGQTIGKTPFSVGIADVSAPHFISVRKDGFEPFEQMISASSTWAKTKLGKEKAALLVLKINAKLKAVPGATPAGAAAGGGEGKPGTEPGTLSGDPAAKVDVARPDRPLPPSEAPAESPP